MEVTQLGGVLSLAHGQSLFSACQHPNQHSQPGLDASHTRSHTSGRVRVRRRRAKALLRGCAKGLAAATCRPQPSPNLHLPTRPLFTGHVHVAPKYRLKLSLEPAAETGTPTHSPGQARTTGASGGAIRSPWDRMPAKLVVLDPCHSSLRLCSCLNGL